MSVVITSTAYTIPLQDNDHYISIWTDHPATAVKMQLKSMLTGRGSRVIELDPRATKMTIKALAELMQKLDVS